MKSKHKVASGAASLKVRVEMVPEGTHCMSGRSPRENSIVCGGMRGEAVVSVFNMGAELLVPTHPIDQRTLRCIADCMDAAHCKTKRDCILFVRNNEIGFAIP